jgi:hypothetical protein
MADTYYAWSNFPVEFNEWGQATKTIKVGEKITQSDLKVTDEDWQGLIDVGAVSTDKYPEVDANVSPAEFYAANPEENPNSPESIAAENEAAMEEEAPKPATSSNKTP